jgi:hypothetical protein
MIAVDNKELNWDNPTTPNEIFVADRVKWLLANKKRIVFERLMVHNDMGALITRPGSRFDLVAFRQNPKTSKKEKWVLTDSILFNAEKKFYKPQRMTAQLDIDINVQKDPEKAFFFYEIFQTGVNNVGYRMRDYDKEAEAVVSKESIEFEVGNIIYNKLSEDDINLRCYALGVDIEDKGLARKKKDLFDMVKRLAANKSHTLTYESFINEAKQNSEELKLTAYVSKAFKDKVLEVENMVVRYKDSRTILCALPANRLADYVNYVADWLAEHKIEKEGFLASVQGVIEEVAQTAIDYQNITNVQKLRSIATKVYGIPIETIPTTAKADELKKMIAEKELALK